MHVKLNIQLFGGRGSWSSLNEILKDNERKLHASIVAKVNSTKNIEIHDDKIDKFSLKVGAKHSEDFFNAGYTINDKEKLREDLKELYKEGKKENI